MSSSLEEEDGGEHKGSMWELDQKLDQPMDDEAGTLRNMYKEKKFYVVVILRLDLQQQPNESPSHSHAIPPSTSTLDSRIEEEETDDDRYYNGGDELVEAEEETEGERIEVVEYINYKKTKL